MPETTGRVDIEDTQTLTHERLTVVVVERQHKPNTPDVWEYVATCATMAVAQAYIAACIRRPTEFDGSPNWRDEDDYRSGPVHVLTAVDA